MQSIGALSAGHQKYFSKLANPDYYLSGGEPEGHWFGKGAEALCLKGKVTRRDLNELFRGYVHGMPLVQNAGRDDRQCGSDECFNMPKSGSVAFALFPEFRERIRGCQEDAVKYALSDVESTILFSRKGKGGREHVPAKMVAALYEHCCSRAGDPHLHTHCLVINVGVQEDGTTRALISKPLYDHKMRVGALYRSKLAELFEQRLGFKCKTVETWFEIEGIPKELCDLFSTRRKEILAKLGELGLESASAAAYATLGTRKPKTLVPPRAELFQRWSEQARGFDLNINNVVKDRSHNIPVTENKSIAPNADTVLDSVSQTHDSLDDEKLIKERVHKIVSEGVANLSMDDLRRLEKEINNWEKNSFQFAARKQQLPVSDSDKRKLIRSVDAIQCRLSFFDWSILNVEQAIHKFSKPRAVLRTQIDYELKQFKRAIQKKRAIKINRRRLPRQAKQHLSREEADAVRAIVNNRGPLQVINTNDTSSINLCMRVCNEIWGKSNVDVWGFSLSRNGADKLQEETGIRSRSFKTFELMRKPTATYRVKYAIKELARQALFNHGYKLNTFKTKGKLLVVTDAQDLNPNQMNELLGAIKKSKGRLILIGSADLQKGRTTAFDHVAYRTSRNDKLQIRNDYIYHKSIETVTQENERNKP